MTNLARGATRPAVVSSYFIMLFFWYHSVIVISSNNFDIQLFKYLHGRQFSGSMHTSTSFLLSGFARYNPSSKLNTSFPLPVLDLPSS